MLVKRHDFEFFTYLKRLGADNMFFCYRWILLEMKREFSFDDAVTVLEVGVTKGQMQCHKEVFWRYLFIYLFSFLLTINLKLIIVHVEIKIVNKKAATKRSTLLHGRRTFEQSDVMLIRKGKQKEDN